MPTKPPQCQTRQPSDLIQRTRADRQLQTEIDKALASLRDGLPFLVDLRLARVLDKVVEASWSEHARFQDEALFPLIAKSKDTPPDVRSLLHRLGNEHIEIAKRQSDTMIRLRNIALGRRVAESGLQGALERTLNLRRHHNEAEAALENAIPRVINSIDQMEFKQWAASNGACSFPIGLILDLWD